MVATAKLFRRTATTCGGRSCWRFVLLLSFLALVTGQASAQYPYGPMTYGPHNGQTGCEPPLTWYSDPCDICGDVNVCPPDCEEGLYAGRPAVWYASADFIPLISDPSNDVILARREAAVGLGDPLFTTGSVENEFYPGGRFVLGRTINDCYQLEIAYQGHYSGDDRAQLVNPTATLSYAFSGFSPADDGTFIDARSTWQMSTAEFNWRRWVTMPPGRLDLQLIVGARYFTTSDTLRVRTVGTVNTDATVAADNDMFGPQLGFNSRWLTTQSSYFDFEVKSAMCWNDTSVVQSRVGGPVLQASETTTTFVTDFMLTFNMMLTPWISARAGYQAILANGLAMSSENLVTATPLPPAIVVLDGGDRVFHGPVLGLSANW